MRYPFKAFPELYVMSPITLPFGQGTVEHDIAQRLLGTRTRMRTGTRKEPVEGEPSEYVALHDVVMYGIVAVKAWMRGGYNNPPVIEVKDVPVFEDEREAAERNIAGLTELCRKHRMGAERFFRALFDSYAMADGPYEGFGRTEAEDAVAVLEALVDEGYLWAFEVLNAYSDPKTGYPHFLFEVADPCSAALDRLLQPVERRR